MKVKTVVVCKLLIIVFLFPILFSCKSTAYLFINDTSRIGVDFRTGTWLLNEIDCDKNYRDQLTTEAFKSLKSDLQERLFYINDVPKLLIARKTALNPNKIKLKELKEGTGFDYFINIQAKKNRSDFNSVEIYQDKTSSGKNESEVILEIYDLNLQEIIYSKHVIGSDSKDNTASVWGTKESSKLIDNIEFYKSSKKLMLGGLKKILKNLKKKSLVNK